MRGFFTQILGSACIFAFLLEVILRLTGIAASEPPSANIDGDFLLQPHAKGDWVRGGFGEIKSYYHINNQGYNSMVDYDDAIDSSSLKIALLGDSFIQGMHVDIHQSIGRLAEQLSDLPMIVHEFGRAGGNIEDYKRICKEDVNGNYDFVFIWVSEDDFIHLEPYFKGAGYKAQPETMVYKIFRSIHILRYIFKNQGLLNLLNNRYYETASIATEDSLSTIIKPDVLNSFSSDVFFIYDEAMLNLDFFELPNNRFVKLEHKRRPYNFGFDGHWNLNGRKNCADAIVSKLSELRKSRPAAAIK